jgi:drug/metabolite transporter (DMT)-like permease
MTTLDVAVRPARRESLLALGAALVTVALWASAFVGIRSAGHEFSPGALALGRLLIGSLALGALVLIRREALPARRDLPAIALCGVLWFGVYNVVLNEAERRVDAGTASMLVNVGPIFVALLAGLLLDEGFPRGLFAGIAVAFAGVVVIALATSEQGIAAGWGSVLCVVACPRILGSSRRAEAAAGTSLGAAGDVAGVHRRRPPSLAYVGGALCLAGVVLVRRP